MNRALELFREISQIPRCSHQEERISDYIVEKAKKWHLDVEKDAANNVIIRKPASPGYEDHPGVILQGHVDMVCEKDEGSDHDFSCDPILWVEKDGYITAAGTTLGADNGVGVAMALAILESDKILHPALEVLCTTGEEIGLIGANALSDRWITGKYLINIDSEEEAVITCGCAGGRTVVFDTDIEREESGNFFYSLSVGNLHGGHSGQDIDKNYLNAIKVATEIIQKIGGRLVSLQGGTKHNAIPRNCRAVFMTEKKVCWDESFVLSYREVEPEIVVTLEQETSKRPLTDESSERVLKMLSEIRHGVYAWFHEKPDTSANVAIARLSDDHFSLMVSIRSNHMEEIEKVTAAMEDLAKVNRVSCRFEGDYAPWTYREDSDLRKKAKEVYRHMMGKEYREDITHGGLECAVFQDKYPSLDMISIGPDMQYVHTPKERLNIASTERMYAYLVRLLGEL